MEKNSTIAAKEAFFKNFGQSMYYKKRKRVMSLGSIIKFFLVFKNYEKN